MVADEVRISIEANPFYVWNTKGVTPIKKKRMEVHKSKTFFGALSISTGKTILHTCQKQTSRDAVHFLNRVVADRKAHYPKTKKPLLLLWDNGGSHKSQEVKDWLTTHPGIIELDNFPPYSPEMNPIEHIWKELKKYINHLRGTSTLPELLNAAQRFLRYQRFHYQLLGMKQERIFKR